MLKQVIRLLFKLAFFWEWVVSHLFRVFDLPLIRLFHLRQVRRPAFRRRLRSRPGPHPRPTRPQRWFSHSLAR